MQIPWGVNRLKEVEAAVKIISASPQNGKICYYPRPVSCIYTILVWSTCHCRYSTLSCFVMTWVVRRRVLTSSTGVRSRVLSSHSNAATEGWVAIPHNHMTEITQVFREQCQNPCNLLCKKSSSCGISRFQNSNSECFLVGLNKKKINIFGLPSKFILVLRIELWTFHSCAKLCHKGGWNSLFTNQAEAVRLMWLSSELWQMLLLGPVEISQEIRRLNGCRCWKAMWLILIWIMFSGCESVGFPGLADGLATPCPTEMDDWADPVEETAKLIIALLMLQNRPKWLPRCYWL